MNEWMNECRQCYNKYLTGKLRPSYVPCFKKLSNSKFWGWSITLFYLTSKSKDIFQNNKVYCYKKHCFPPKPFYELRQSEGQPALSFYVGCISSQHPAQETPFSPLLLIKEALKPFIRTLFLPSAQLKSCHHLCKMVTLPMLSLLYTSSQQ